MCELNQADGSENNKKVVPVKMHLSIFKAIKVFLQVSPRAATKCVSLDPAWATKPLDKSGACRCVGFLSLGFILNNTANKILHDSD